MNGMKYRNRFTTLAVVLLMGSLLWTSCQKVGGDYAFVNTENTFDGSGYDYIVSKTGIYDSLVKAVDRVPWLKDSLLIGTDSVTLFAPSNASFRLIMNSLNIARASAGRDPLYIDDLDADNLDTLLSRYVVHGGITTDAIQFVDGLDLTTVNYNYPMHGQKIFSEATGFQGGGPTNITFSDTKRSQFQRDWIRTETIVVNIITKNGVVHGLKPEHEVGFGEFISRFNK